MDSRTGLSSACARSKVERAHGSHSMQCAWLGLGEKRILVTPPVLSLPKGPSAVYTPCHKARIQRFKLA